MRGFPRQGFTFWGVFFGLAFPAACGSSGLVGGECASGYIDCDGRCADEQNDPVNCGHCARACDPGVACRNGVCDGIRSVLPMAKEAFNARRSATNQRRTIRSRLAGIV